MKSFTSVIRGIALSALLATTPVSAQQIGSWSDDLAALQFEPEYVGGYWSGGLDFFLMLYCSPDRPGLVVEFGLPNTQTAFTPELIYFLRIGDQQLILPWDITHMEQGFVQALYTSPDQKERWDGQEALIQLLLNGNIVEVYAASRPDLSDAAFLHRTDPAPAHPAFQALSATCGSGELSPVAAPVEQPPLAPDTPSTWVLGAGTDLWTGLTAFALSENETARGFLTCGANGQARFVLSVEGITPTGVISFGNAYIGDRLFDIQATPLDGAFDFPVPPDLMAAMLDGRTVNFDSLVPGIANVPGVATFNILDAADVFRQALAPCAATALP